MLKSIEERPGMIRCEKLGTKVKLNREPDSQFESSSERKYKISC